MKKRKENKLEMTNRAKPCGCIYIYIYIYIHGILLSENLNEFVSITKKSNVICHIKKTCKISE